MKFATEAYSPPLDVGVLLSLGMVNVMVKVVPMLHVNPEQVPAIVIKIGYRRMEVYLKRLKSCATVDYYISQPVGGILILVVCSNLYPPGITHWNVRFSLSTDYLSECRAYFKRAYPWFNMWCRLSLLRLLSANILLDYQPG